MLPSAGDRFPSADTVARLLDATADHSDYLWGDSEVDRGGQILPDPAHQMLRLLYRQMTVCHQSLAVRTELLQNHPISVQRIIQRAGPCGHVDDGVTGGVIDEDQSRIFAGTGDGLDGPAEGVGQQPSCAVVRFQRLRVDNGEFVGSGATASREERRRRRVRNKGDAYESLQRR